MQSVFQTMLEKAVRICDAKFGSIHRWDGRRSRTLLATHNTPPAFAEARTPFTPCTAETTSLSARMVATKAVVQVVDLAADQTTLNDAIRRPLQPSNWAVRTVCDVPMLKENELMGMLIYPPRSSSIHR